MMRNYVFKLFLILTVLLFGCSRKDLKFTSLSMLEGGKTIAVPTGTVADQFVLKRLPDAKIVYYNNVYDCALAVSAGKADASVYDRPVLENIAAKNGDLAVIEENLLPDHYGFAVGMDHADLKQAIDETLHELKQSGIYDDMLKRWLPEHGSPLPMPELNNQGPAGILYFGTAAVTEPMSYIDSNHRIVGFDIEFAQRIANHLDKRLEIINMEFGAMLPALISGKVDMIGAGLSITEERAKSVLFSESYYEGGLAAIVKSSSTFKTAKASQESAPTEETWKVIGVLMGSIHETYAKKTYPGSQIQSFNMISDMLMALSAGKVDAAFLDQSSVKAVFATNKNFILLKKDLFIVQVGAGFQEQADDLREEFNRFLKLIKEDGTYAAMEKRWIVDTAAEMPEIANPNPEGVIRVGIVSDIGLPFEARIDGKWQGFEVELGSRFAAWTGKAVEWVDMPFGSLLPSMVSGKIDMITASMMINEEREKSIDFSDPYYASGVSIIGMKKDLAGGSSEINKEEKSFWVKLSEGFKSNILHERRYLMILRGLLVTILISIFAALTGTILGGLVCYMRMSKSKFASRIASFYISLIRGTPVLVLLMIIYYVVFAAVNINAVLVAIIAFGINFAAYVSEMFRTGIQSVDIGQKEAGIASGFTKVQTFIYIIMPQAVRQVMPVYKGEFISLVKMTSIVGYIAVEDLTKVSDIIRSRTFDAFFPLIMAALVYITIAWLLTRALDRIEINIDPKSRLLKIRKGVAK